MLLKGAALKFVRCALDLWSLFFQQRKTCIINTSTCLHHYYDLETAFGRADRRQEDIKEADRQTFFGCCPVLTLPPVHTMALTDTVNTRDVCYFLFTFFFFFGECECERRQCLCNSWGNMRPRTFKGCKCVSVGGLCVCHLYQGLHLKIIFLYSLFSNESIDYFLDYIDLLFGS